VLESARAPRRESLSSVAQPGRRNPEPDSSDATHGTKPPATRVPVEIIAAAAESLPLAARSSTLAPSPESAPWGRRRGAARE
jgi:hypothetical protein